jgi:hypothetical protein
MRHRQHAVLALATLVLAGALAAAAPAAELTGPSTPAVPSACAAPAGQLAPPPMLTPVTAAVEPLVITSNSCNCTNNLACSGKKLGASCGGGMVCVRTGGCEDLPNGNFCSCIFQQ